MRGSEDVRIGSPAVSAWDFAWWDDPTLLSVQHFVHLSCSPL